MNEQPSHISDNKRYFWNRQLPLESETCFFILVNALDVYMTYLLLQTSEFRESNEVANYFLSRFGFSGMIAFKFVVVAAVLMITQFIAARKLRTARWLLYTGTAITAAVVIYSCGLYYNFRFGG